MASNGHFVTMQLSVEWRIVFPLAKEVPMTHPAFEWKTAAAILLTAAIVLLMIASATGYLRF